MGGDERSALMECVSDLRLYLHQRYGLPLKARRGVDTPAAQPSDDSPLSTLRAELVDCRRCALCGGRTSVVFGEGPDRAQVMIVGEAPGAEEDIQGKPFVGRSGQLLTKMLEAIGLSRDSVYITNVVKCRPPENRDPKPDEVDTCSPFLREQIRIIQPRLLLALGSHAAQTILQTKEPIMQLRGKSYTYAGVPLIVTLHPAACLYNPNNKKFVWEDIKGIPNLLKND